LEVELLPQKDLGVLVVRASPPEADVTIDGKELGRAPVEAQIASGEHRVRASLAGHRDADTTVVVTVNERKEVELSLEKSPPIVSRWWFWTGIAVVVAGGVVLTVALTTERAAGHGDIKPGQVSGPLLRW
jgi:hypothetical protein